MIRVFRKSKLLLVCCRVLFLVVNENYYSLLLSLMSMYSLSVSHILVKLVLMLVRFPKSIFVVEVCVLLLFYSFTLAFGFFVILNKLHLDFAKHRKLTSKYLEKHKEYCTLVDDLRVINQMMKIDQQTTESNKSVNKVQVRDNRVNSIHSPKQSNQHKETNPKQRKEIGCPLLPQPRLRLQLRSNKIDALESSKKKLKLLRLKIARLQITPLLSSFPTVIKLCLFVMVILFFNSKQLVLSILVLAIEVGNTLMILRLNSKVVSLLCFVKESFLVWMFLFMLFARQYQGQMSLDHYFDALSLEYILLFFVLSNLIRKSQQLPELRDTKSRDSD